jgi:plastocyanin
MFVAALVAGTCAAPALTALAATQPGTSTVDVYDPPRGFEVPHADDPKRIEIQKGGTVGWLVSEGEHTVTPKDAGQWGDEGSGEKHLTPQDSNYTKQFKTPGDFVYYCSIHGSIDADGKPQGMWGVVHVNDTATTTTTPAPTTTTTVTTAPATSATTRPGTTPTTAAPASSAGTKPAVTAAPAPTTTTAKPSDKDKGKDKNKDNKDETTTTTAPPPPPVDLPDSAIIPTLPGSPGTPSTDGIGVPAETPEGDAVALLKSKKGGGGGNAVKLLIVSGLGLGALGVGTAGYKYANRSSKYFPA